MHARPCGSRHARSAAAARWVEQVLHGRPPGEGAGTAGKGEARAEAQEASLTNSVYLFNRTLTSFHRVGDVGGRRCGWEMWVGGNLIIVNTTHTTRR